ncbi:thiolase [Amycolatopsis endophytica]|uniref:Acetyl-CoA acetyltransferase n=1 Tax=Amycolatopsis endophytica TaxID=860233 RepID=A0A853B190_9PSEU|nr:acetyl-CoA acetyltransferase [Amycolatopsis endophytica]NYI88843.1 acetyl-CoA acetyltransferase [Amycolatopsis endophytica]
MTDTREPAAIVGVAESDLGEVGPGLSALDLIGQATTRALADAGLDKSDIDGVLCHSAFFDFPPSAVAEYLGIRPTYTDSTAIGGASFVGYLRHAALAIEAGLCEVALITYGSTQRSSSSGLVTSGSALVKSYEAPFSPRMPVTAYALAAARHMHEFGTTREQLAEVAVAARKWAQLNPAAFKRGPLTVADVLASPMISSPLTVRDCCLVTDGGGAVLVTSKARAKTLRKPPVYVLGCAEGHAHRHISQMPDLTTTAARASGERAFAAAGLQPSDVDVAELYDAFTINTILFLEDLGFCAKGEGGAFVADGAIAPGGRLAVNTSGGGLSYGHPGMFGIFLVIEAARQLRGECGERQVPDAHVALAHGNGGVLSTQVTALLGDETTQ